MVVRRGMGDRDGVGRGDWCERERERSKSLGEAEIWLFVR